MVKLLIGLILMAIAYPEANPGKGHIRMSHQIFDNMMAYKGATPWHGLGVSVAELATGDEMLATAGLTWSVQRRALAMRDGNGGNLLTEQLKGYKAIVRADTDKVFQVATERYHPVQNKAVIDFFHEYCTAGQATMETVGGLREGAVVWALAKLNGGSNADLGHGDELKGYMLLATSHDGSLRTIGKPTQVRVVCHNTLSAAIGDKSTHEFRMKHTRKWSTAVEQEAKRVMGMAIEQIQETNELAHDLTRVHIDDKGRLEFVSRLLTGTGLLDTIVDTQARSPLDQILAESETEQDLGRVGKAILECIINAPGADLVTARNTLWGAVNGATYYADHVRGRSQDNRLASAWFGQGNQLKQQAVTVAQSMARIGG